jgi:hypothetical protein
VSNDEHDLGSPDRRGANEGDDTERAGTVDLLTRLEADVRSRTEFDISTEGTFASVLKGCFAKTYDFVLLVHKELHPGAAFYLAPALPGICEDFIALSFLHKKRDPEVRDELLKAKAQNQLATAAQKQVAFFSRVRPFQPVFALDPAKFPPANLPPARNMANEVGLSELYDFVYAITSDVVHFNPRIILRNAWGPHPRYSHSASHFDAYYQAFCRIYGVYFLCLFARAFASEIQLSAESTDVVTELERALADELRWPEAVTYEEMNVEPPSTVIRVLLRSALRLETGETPPEGSDGADTEEAD